MHRMLIFILLSRSIHTRIVTLQSHFLFSQSQHMFQLKCQHNKCFWINCIISFYIEEEAQFYETTHFLMRNFFFDLFIRKKTIKKIFFTNSMCVNRHCEIIQNLAKELKAYFTFLHTYWWWQSIFFVWIRNIF